MNKLAVIAVLAVSGVSLSPSQAAGKSCEQLAQLNLANAKITSAQTISTGAFEPPAAAAAWLRGDQNLFKRLPAFCRVTAVARPSSDSDIKIEVWMPSTGWNGKFRGQGNGGFAGGIDYGALAAALAQGYA